eukprot:TRINITY_DN15449_c0_g1_i19.p2 TRINITY_DN15449_c0_g1~~TRINITY_DN15449_c0_g1_i19.p2  ORF type:complete len:121 (+),score=21.41 TRINITY_DN15449_c0_g1_i19:80-442(+)
MRTNGSSAPDAAGSADQPGELAGPLGERRIQGHRGSALVEGQRDLAEADAELAHHGLVQHHALVHQVHPVVELHVDHLAVHRQAQCVAPVEGVARGLTLRQIGRAVQQECRDRSRMPSSA